MALLTAVPRPQTATDGKRAATEDAALRSIVVGPDLVLVISADERITLSARGGDEVGTFDDVRSAWAMVDRLDLESHSVSDAKSEIECDDRPAAATAGRSRDALRAA